MNVALDLALRGLRQHLRAPGWVAARATLALLLMFAVVVTAAGRGAVGASGLDLFSALVTIDFLFLAAIAIGPSSSALAEEREGDTLGVLQLAGLSPGAILFAKAGGLFASTMLLLVVQVPFATLATVLGGIDARQVATVFVLLLSTLFGAQGIALACAASAPNT
ncbi:MAG TPA: ABC transporter permease, partial [Planctomycetota bacterium]|nr:ABC transporter permease [Planctomycetota bacterium]